MKDSYGIGSAMEMAMEMYSRSARTTGRTEFLVNAVRDGDTVIFHRHQHLKHFNGRLRELKPRSDLNLIVLRLDGGHLDDHALKGITGAIHFDHSFIEEHYRMTIKSAGSLFKHIVQNYGNREVAQGKSIMMRDARKWDI